MSVASWRPIRTVGRNDVGVVPEIIGRGQDSVDLVSRSPKAQQTTVRQSTSSASRFRQAPACRRYKARPRPRAELSHHADVYDPDRLAADQDQLRRYYRNHGYADVSIAKARPNMTRLSRALS